MVMKDLESLTIEDMKPIVISFKKNEDEFEIYKWIISHSGKSNFVKDKLREAKASEEGNLKEAKIFNKNLNTSINQSNLIDF